MDRRVGRRVGRRTEGAETVCTTAIRISISISVCSPVVLLVISSCTSPKAVKLTPPNTLPPIITITADAVPSGADETKKQRKHLRLVTAHSEQCSLHIAQILYRRDTNSILAFLCPQSTMAILRQDVNENKPVQTSRMQATNECHLKLPCLFAAQCPNALGLSVAMKNGCKL